MSPVFLTNFSNIQWQYLVDNLPLVLLKYINELLVWFTGKSSDILGTSDFQRDIVILLVVSFVVLFVLKGYNRKNALHF